MYRLKPGQEDFVVVDGPDRGRKFEKNVEYKTAPKGYEDRFQAVKLTRAVKPKAIKKGVTDAIE